MECLQLAAALDLRIMLLFSKKTEPAQSKKVFSLWNTKTEKSHY